MAKVTFFLLAFFAFQGCLGASLEHEKLTNLQEAIKDFSTSMRNIEEIISFINGHLVAVAQNYEYQMNDIIEKRPPYAIIEELSNTISSLESEANNESKSCITDARKMIIHITQDLTEGFDNCISEAHIAEGRIKSVIEIIERKATNLQAKIADKFHKCLQNNDAVSCLRDEIVLFKNELSDLQSEIDDSHKFIHNNVNDGIRHLDICLQPIKEDIIIKSKNIVDYVTKCIMIISETSKFATKGIHNIFKKLIENVKHIIHILSHLPPTIKDIPKKINEIISHISIATISYQLKSEIQNIIKDGGCNAEKCHPEADKKIHILVKSAEKSSQICLLSTDKHVENIKQDFDLLVQEAKQILININKQIFQCFIENKLNSYAFTKCLEKHSIEYKQKISDLKKNVKETIENNKQKAEDILQSLASCMNKIQLNFIQKGQELIHNVEKCIQNYVLLF